MTMNPLPPQAYTKETLVKAYQWLQHQNETIKEMATTPDIMVSLYMRAKIQGEGSLERPSIQNFKNELKNLAGMMGEFDVLEPQAPAPSQAPTPAAGHLPPNFVQGGMGKTLGVSPTTQGGVSNATPNGYPNANLNGPLNGAAIGSWSENTHGNLSANSNTQQTRPMNQTELNLPPLGSINSSTFPKNRPLPDLDTRSWLMIQEVKNQLNLSSDQEALRVLISVGHVKLKALMSEK